jgi:hypothetical protein
MNGVVSLIFALTCLLPSMACAKAAPKPQTEQQKPTPPSAPPLSQQKDRTEIPEIAGCTRSQTSFYRGKVLSFLRTRKSIEITIRTEWDTTEKLVHSTKENSILYRLQNHPISAAEFRQIESRLKDSTAEVRATVWVCQINGSQNVKIIDWEPTRANQVLR